MDCFVAYAPRNDAGTRLPDLAACFARGLLSSSRPRSRGRRECRAPDAPADGVTGSPEAFQPSRTSYGAVCSARRAAWLEGLRGARYSICGCNGHPAFPAPSVFEGMVCNLYVRSSYPAKAGIQYAVLSRASIPVSGILGHPLSRVTTAQTRSARLTIFWHCGWPHFSFRTSHKARLRQPTVNGFAPGWRFKGSGNADSRRKGRSSGWSGRCRPCLRDSGCVLAHPPSWRASASYRPLRAVWAVCAWALRGSREITRPLQRSRKQRTT